MKLIRDIQNREFSNIFIPALAVLFVFSLSFHNHHSETHDDISFESHSSLSHSIEGCSACLLQGNLQAPTTKYSFNNYGLHLYVAYSTIDFVVPNSFLDLDKPSRAPPSV